MTEPKPKYQFIKAKEPKCQYEDDCSCSEIMCTTCEHYRGKRRSHYKERKAQYYAYPVPMLIGIHSPYAPGNPWSGEITGTK